MGPAQATETIRKALSMGADKAVHVIDDALHGSDALATSLALAKAIEQPRVPTWCMFGSESTDARMSRRARDGRRAPRPAAADLRQQGDRRRLDREIQRQTDDGYDVVEAALPAVVSVVEKINEPRYPSFKGIMAAKKKTVEKLDVADLGVDAEQVGLAGARTRSWSSRAAPPRRGGTIVTDEGDGGVARSPSSCPRRSSSEEAQTRWLRYWFSSSTSTVTVKKVTLELLTLAAPAR